MASHKKVMVYFGFQRLDSMLEKGNVWYVRNYEPYFDEIHVVYLRGDDPKSVTQGTSHLVSLGSTWRWIDFALAPWRLLRYVRTHNAQRLLTADIVFGWWTFSLVRLAGYKVVLMPVCIPEEMYRDNGQSLSGLPIPVERFLIRLTFLQTSAVLTGYSFGSFVEWLSNFPLAKSKLIVVNALPEALSSPGFMASIGSKHEKRTPQLCRKLIYVGRLHKEKLVDDLIHMMAILKNEGLGSRYFKLVLVGDGPERDALRALADELQVDEAIDFVGATPNEEVPKWLLGSDVFVSPLTGQSLREATICGLPIVAYDRDWLHGLLRHNETALLVPSRDIQGMVEQVKHLVADPDLAVRMAAASRELAEKFWSADAVASSMAELDVHLHR